MYSRGFPIAIVLVTLILAGTAAWLYRWQIVPTGAADNGAYRLDRLTGDVAYCVKDECKGAEPVPDYLSMFLKKAEGKKQ